jgi:hypothetical protein
VLICVRSASGQRTLAGKIAAVARYVQQRIRYAAVEVGLGGYQPHAAATVLANGYGDCKDKATLLIAMLRTLGVRADYVLLNAERGIVPRGYASPKSFDHAIVAIRWPDKTAASNLYAWLGAPGPGHLLLFDPTDPATPWGWLPAAEQGGEALLASHAGGRSVQLPVLASALNRRLRSARFVMRGDGSLLGSVEEVRTGVFAGRMHGQMDPTPRQQRRWQVRFDRVLPGIQLADWNGTQDGGTVLVRYRLTVRPYLQLSGTTVVLPPWLFPLATPSLQEDGARRYPIRLGTVGSRTDFYRIQLARNLQVGALPSPVNLVLAAPSAPAPPHRMTPRRMRSKTRRPTRVTAAGCGSPRRHPARSCTCSVRSPSTPSPFPPRATPRCGAFGRLSAGTRAAYCSAVWRRPSQPRRPGIRPSHR